MELYPFTPRDAAAVEAWVTLANDVLAVDAPHARPETPGLAVGRFTHGWDGEIESPYLARVAGELVGWGSIATTDYDNLDAAFLSVEVHPAHRRRGHGSVLLEALLEEARRRGRTKAIADGWDVESGRLFAEHHGFERRLSSMNRRQVLAAIDWDTVEELHAAALPRAVDYDLERWPVPTPEDRLGALAELTASINDAPLDDLDYEDEVFTPERIRAYETARAGRGERLYRLLARHRPTGELAAQTVVAVSGEDPTWADQHDTSVLRDHRGHRLGLLLKVAMLRWLQEAEPQLEVIDTWNAESNDHMIGVNQALGYRVVGREWAYQRVVG